MSNSSLPSNMVTALEPGWYWVKFRHADEWLVVSWTGSELYSPYHYGAADVDWVEHIGPRIPTPDEA